MADNFFSNPQPAASANGFLAPAAAPAPVGNPFQPQAPGGQGGYQQYATNPQMNAATAAMIYQRLGYWDGQPTEIDIISDIIKSSTPVSRFLASEQGFPALAQFLSVLIDYKLVSFFKEYKLGMVQDDSGQMFLQPLAEQPTDRGKELSTMTMAEVSTSMTAISEQLRNTLIAQADALLADHRQAAGLIAAQGGMEGIVAELTDGGGRKGGMLSAVVGGVTNTALRAVGVPVAPASHQPPPPPGVGR
mgnify:CR=1 FL=1|tara:strand:- start:2725 stop:3465 length:741 start_codon:yes stop_codon:yes gene_type:complete